MLEAGQVLTPPSLETVGGHLVYLAGPVTGAGDWREEAIAFLREADPSISVANPRREGWDGIADVESQADWEDRHVRRAIALGCVLFWLPPSPGGAPATRFLLGEMKARHELDGSPFVLGVAPGFRGGRGMLRALERDCPEVPVVKTLKGACEAAVAYCQRGSLARALKAS